MSSSSNENIQHSNMASKEGGGGLYEFYKPTNTLTLSTNMRCRFPHNVSTLPQIIKFRKLKMKKCEKCDAWLSYQPNSSTLYKLILEDGLVGNYARSTSISFMHIAQLINIENLSI